MASIQKRSEEIARSRKKAEPSALQSLLQSLLKIMSLLLQGYLLEYTRDPENISQADS
jgi:hypothetical protein